MNRVLATTVAVLATATGAFVAVGAASAEDTTVNCQSPGVWLIVNSEAGVAMTFTTDQGHSGSIPAGGSTTVGFSGTSLTVFGTWTNGTVGTDTGTGECLETPPPTGKRVTICHRPPGNPGNAHTIRIGASALPNHLAHGDTQGECTP